MPPPSDALSPDPKENPRRRPSPREEKEGVRYDTPSGPEDPMARERRAREEQRRFEREELSGSPSVAAREGLRRFEKSPAIVLRRAQAKKRQSAPRWDAHHPETGRPLGRSYHATLDEALTLAALDAGDRANPKRPAAASLRGHEVRNVFIAETGQEGALGKGVPEKDFPKKEKGSPEGEEAARKRRSRGRMQPVIYLPREEMVLFQRDREIFAGRAGGKEAGKSWVDARGAFRPLAPRSGAPEGGKSPKTVREAALALKAHPTVAEEDLVPFQKEAADALERETASFQEEATVTLVASEEATPTAQTWLVAPESGSPESTREPDGRIHRPLAEALGEAEKGHSAPARAVVSFWGEDLDVRLGTVGNRLRPMTRVGREGEAALGVFFDKGSGRPKVAPMLPDGTGVEPDAATDLRAAASEREAAPDLEAAFERSRARLFGKMLSELNPYGPEKPGEPQRIAAASEREPRERSSGGPELDL